MNDKYNELKEAIQSGKLFDFLATDGYRFSNSELIDILKEVVYSAELMSKHYNSGFDFSSFCEVLIENLNEHTSIFDEE